MSTNCPVHSPFCLHNITTHLKHFEAVQRLFVPLLTAKHYPATHKKTKTLYGQHGLPCKVLKPLPSGGAGQNCQQLCPPGCHSQLGAIRCLFAQGQQWRTWPKLCAVHTHTSTRKDVPHHGDAPSHAVLTLGLTGEHHHVLHVFLGPQVCRVFPS